MTTLSTEQEIADIRARLEAACRVSQSNEWVALSEIGNGVWWVDPKNDWKPTPRENVSLITTGNYNGCSRIAEFCAHAPADIAMLLAWLEANR